MSEETKQPDLTEQRLQLLEQRLVDLAARCWPHCGATFADELAAEIRDSRTREPEPKKGV